MPAIQNSALNCLKLVVGLIIVGFLLEGVYDFNEPGRPAFLHAINLFMLLSLLLALIILEVLGRRFRQNELHRNLLDRQTMQQEVDNAILRYKNLMECAGDAILVVGAKDGKLQEVNQQGLQLFGYSKEELESLDGLSLVSIEEQHEYSSLVLRVRRRGMVQKENLTFVRRDGSLFIGDVSARLIDLGGEDIVQVIIRDITEKRQIDLEIRQRNRKLSILNNIIAKANQSLELQAVLTVTLRETFEIFGAEGGIVHLLAPEEDKLLLAATHNITADLRKDLGSCSLDPAAGCITFASNKCHTVPDLETLSCPVGKLLTADGWKSALAAPLMAKSKLIGILHIMTRQNRHFTEDELQFFTTVCHHIGIVIEHARLFDELNWKTEELLRSHRLLEKSSLNLTVSQGRLKNNLSMVERANVELERLDRMKNHFLGMISHEFKTPLTSILGGAEFLLAEKGGKFTADERQLLEMIYHGGARLNEIVSDLLRVARLETKSLTINKKPLQLHEILDFLLQEINPRLERRQQRIQLQNLQSLPYFNGDREYLMEVFMELLENAMKFTPDQGVITISGWVTDRMQLSAKQEILERFNPYFYQLMGENCYLHVEISDSGIGIAAEEQEKVFEKFYSLGDIRHHTSSKDKFQGKGAGLGLAIVKGMTEAHGGMVWVESQTRSSNANRGSSFSLLLPLEEGVSQTSFPFMQQSNLNFS